MAGERQIAVTSLETPTFPANAGEIEQMGYSRSRCLCASPSRA